MDVELMRADPAGLNEIKSASPETFNPREIAIGTPAPFTAKLYYRFVFKTYLTGTHGSAF